MCSFSRWLTRGENAGDTSSMRALETSRAETSNGEGGNSRVASYGHEPEVPLTRGDSLLDACTLDFPEAG